MAGGVTIKDHSQEDLTALEQAITRGLEKCGLTAEAYAKILCPVKTGRLRNSISHAVDASKKRAYIGTNVKYAPFVELGTRKRKRKPFLKPAAQGHSEEYKAMIEAELKGVGGA